MLPVIISMLQRDFGASFEYWPAMLPQLPFARAAVRRFRRLAATLRSTSSPILAAVQASFAAAMPTRRFCRYGGYDADAVLPGMPLAAS